jgi:hypothetical protein
MRPIMFKTWIIWRAACLSLLLIGCSLDLDPKPAPLTVPIFDLDEGDIPLPSDVVRDVDANKLDMPVDDEDLTAADLAFRNYLNTLDGWSTAFPAKVEFSGPIDPDTITADSLQIWQWKPEARQIDWEWEHENHAPEYTGPIVELDDDNQKIVINPPRYGWDHGAEYFFMVRGGTTGVVDQSGSPLGIEAGFYFMRMREKLDRYEHNRAFPGDDRDERLETATDLEEIRVKLAPIFDFLEDPTPGSPAGIPRDEVVSLWHFTVTQNPELAMDSSSQRVPIPSNLLIDPETGFMDLEPAHWDDELQSVAKLQINEMRGSAVSANLMFEFSKGIDPATATSDTIKVYELADDADPAPLPIEHIKVMNDKGEEPCQRARPARDCRYVNLVVQDDHLPLKPATTYAVVATEGLADPDGRPVKPMLIGHFLRTTEPLVRDGVNQLDSVMDDDLAERLEAVRLKIAPVLDHLGRDKVIAAWPFTTMDARPGMEEALGRAEQVSTPPNPKIDRIRQVGPLTRAAAFDGLFPGTAGGVVRAVYAYRLEGVGKVIEGTFSTPNYLDSATRAFREDGGYELEDVKFTMTVPESAGSNGPVPVVMFGHAIVTDSRFLLTVAGPLARKGFATIGFDLPYHGTRTVCIEASLVAVPNFLPPGLQAQTGFTDRLIEQAPCRSAADATCSETGLCLDANGEVEPFNTFLVVGDEPAIIDLKSASGAAFMDVDHIPYIKDHFMQAFIDYGALKRSLVQGNWQRHVGAPINTDKFYFAGESLGSIIGSVVTTLDPDFERAVFNVIGADMIDLFIDSTFFGPQVDDFLRREEIRVGTQEHERFINIARWIIDSVDPHSIAHLHTGTGIKSLIQIDSGPPRGDFIIPNRTTHVFQRVSGVPLREYNSNLHIDLIVPVLPVGESMLRDMADFLAGEFDE